MGTLLNRRRYMGGGGVVDKIIITSISNAPLMAICYAQNWCANADYMLKSEAEAVTDIGIVFRDNTTVSTFNEFKYFTGVTSLGQRAFQNAVLTEITLPSTITSLTLYTFRNCTQMQRFTVLATTPPSATSNTFTNMTGTVYVPASSVEAYRSAFVWKNLTIKSM